MDFDDFQNMLWQKSAEIVVKVYEITKSLEKTIN